MTRELFWLTLTVVLTGLMWVPYIINRAQVRGLTGAMANPSRADKPQAEWANRMMFAHDNAVENLIQNARQSIQKAIEGAGSLELSQDVGQRDASLQEIGDCAQQIAQQSTSRFGRDLETDRTRLYPQPKEVEIDGPELQIEDGTGEAGWV